MPYSPRPPAPDRTTPDGHAPGPSPPRGALAAALAGAVGDQDRSRVEDLLVDHGIALVLAGREALVAEALDVLARTGGEDHAVPAGHGTPDVLLGVEGMLHRARGETARAAPVAGRAVRAARALTARLLERRRAPTRAEAAQLMDAACLHAWLARFRWAEVPDALAATALALDEPLDDDPSPHVLHVADGADPARLCLLLRETAALETWAGLLDRAAAHTDRALLTAEAVDSPRLRGAALADRCLDQVLRGDLEPAARTARESLAHADEAGRLTDGYLSRPHLALGLAAFYALRLPEARDHLAATRHVLARSPEPLVAALALLLEVWLLAEEGDVVEARRLLAAAPVLPEAAPPLLAGSAAFVGAQLAVRDGDLPAAARAGAHLRALGSELGAAVVEAGVLEARGQVAAAVTVLEEAVDLAPSWGGETVASVLAEAVLVRLLATVGQGAAAQDRLRQVLSRAAPGGLAQPVLMGLGPVAAPLLAELTAGAGAHPTAHALRALATARGPVARSVLPGPRPAGLPGPSAAPAPPARVDGERLLYVPPLTTRELDVLRRLALGESYADVAESLHLSANTVKTHVSSVYRKLGVERRSAALRRARDLGIL